MPPWRTDPYIPVHDCNPRNLRYMQQAIGTNKMGYIYPEEKKISNKLRKHIFSYKAFKEKT